MRYLRQSTATVIETPPLIDDTDGKTPEDALTVASIDVQLMQPLDSAAVPPDRATNGAFASDTGWTKGTGWDINSTTAGKAHHATGTASDLEQTPSLALVENVAYELVFVVSGFSAGTVTPKIGGTAGTARSSDATFTETIIAGSGALIEFTANSTFVGDLDDVVYKQVPIPITPAASGSSNDMVLIRANTGAYWLELTANQLAIVGRHRIQYFISGALIAWEDFMVIEEAVWDAMYASAAPGPITAAAVNAECDTAISDAALATAAALATVDDFLDTEIAAIVAAVITNAAGADIAADIITVKSTVDNIESGVGIIVQDTDELQTDWVNGGRLDLLVDDILARLPAALVSGRMNSDVIALVGQTGAATRLERMFSSGHHGVAQGGTPGTITFASGADSNDNFYRGSIVATSNFTGKKQYRFVHAYDGMTKVASITPDWIVTPNNTTEYVALPFGFADTVAISGAVAAAGAITEARLVELDAGNLPSDIDDILADSNELQSDDLPGLIATLDAVADAIKVVTDKFVFTVAGEVDSNIQSVNEVTVTGTGASGDEWGP